MPAPLAPLIGLLFGMAFAWASSAPNQSGHTTSDHRPLAIGSLFGLLVFAPVVAYFVAFAPDWAYAYTVESHRLSAAADLGIVLLSVASVPAGLAIAARPARDRQLGNVLRLATLPLLGVVAAIVIALPRLGVYATYAQYHGNFGCREVAGSSLGYALLWMNLVLLAGAAFTAHALRRLAIGPRRR